MSNGKLMALRASAVADELVGALSETALTHEECEVALIDALSQLLVKHYVDPVHIANGLQPFLVAAITDRLSQKGAAQ